MIKQGKAWWIFLAACFAILLFGVYQDVSASDRRNEGNEQQQRQHQGQQQGQHQDARARASSVGVDGDVTGGSADAFSEGSTAEVGDVSGGDASVGDLDVSGSNNYSSSHESNWFAFSTTFPQASGCFGGAQGGGAGGSGGGFLGFHLLNHDCWTSALAESEANVEIRALLKCGGKKFRNSIAFDQPRSERQRYCVDKMTAVYQAEVARVAEAVEYAVAAGDLAVTENPEEGDYALVLAQVTQEEYEEQHRLVEEKNAQQQNQIDELERRTRAAERRAAEAERKLQELEEQESAKGNQLFQLQQQLREDYERIREEPPAEE